MSPSQSIFPAESFVCCTKLKRS